MKHTMSMPRILFLVLALGLVGCAANVTNSTAATNSELTLAPERELPESVWGAANAGCEEALVEGAYEILGAEGAPDLRVVQNGDAVVCVDTIDAIERELDNSVRGEVDVLINGRQFAFSNGVFLDHRLLISGDPSPQPNRPGYRPADSGEAAGDPSPQPNAPTRPDAADPSPQPNSPPRPNEADPSPQPNGPSTPSPSLLNLLAAIVGNH